MLNKNYYVIIDIYKNIFTQVYLWMKRIRLNLFSLNVGENMTGLFCIAADQRNTGLYLFWEIKSVYCSISCNTKENAIRREKQQREEMGKGRGVTN